MAAGPLGVVVGAASTVIQVAHVVKAHAKTIRDAEELVSRCKSEVEEGQMRIQKIKDEFDQARQQLAQWKQINNDLSQDLDAISCRLMILSEDVRSDAWLSNTLRKILLATSAAIIREENLGECLTHSPNADFLQQLRQDLLDSYHHILSFDVLNFLILETHGEILGTVQVTYITDAMCMHHDPKLFVTYFSFLCYRPSPNFRGRG